jgi:hypothetical protein
MARSPPYHYFKTGKTTMPRLTILALASTLCAASATHAQETMKTFPLFPETKFLSCFAGSPAVTPTATVMVQRDGPRDRLVLTAEHLKPYLKFDVFTVERTNLQAGGKLSPTFTNFGLAWFQSTLHADATGHATTTLLTILIDRPFGFDPDVKLDPTNTFHIGFWFDDPKTAVPCGFTGTTPFNAAHAAGPAAMMSVPNAKTHLGPLCLNPSATDPTTCSG